MAAADHAGFAGSHTKEGIPWSVLTGIAAAEQAALGMRGYAGGLDNPVVYRKGLIPRPSTGNFLIETTYFKPYACCRWIHSAIDAVLDMRAGGLDPTAIERIEVASFRRALSLGNALRPSDIISAQFSIPFALAVALLEGPQALLPMSPDLLGRADLLDLAARTVMVLAPELEARFPGEVPARITIKTRGCTIEREVYCPLGDPGNPLSDSRLVEKAVRLCSPMRVSEDVRNFASNLLGTTLSQIETASFETVIDFVRGSPKSLAEVSGQNSQTHTPVRGD
jgi:2-methylcitrate dehydratase PrpD